MKSLFSVMLGLAVGVYVIYDTINEWLTFGAITVHGKGVPDVTFFGDTILIGAIIKISFAMATVLLAFGFSLFGKSSDRSQSIGIKLLSISFLFLFNSLILYLYALVFLQVRG